jgi:hypothetical protein
MSALEKAGTIVASILGQAPWITTITGAYRISLYQPAVYHGKEPFLLVPCMVAVISTWQVMRRASAMWVIFVSFLVLAGVVYYVYDSYPVLHWIHPVNWIASYCAFALFVAALSRVAVDLLK